MAFYRNSRIVRRVGLIAGLAAVIVVAVFAYTEVRSCATDMAPGGPAERVFNLAIEHGRVAEDMRVLRVTEGDRVRLRWTTDAPLVLHLHGYDIEKKVTPGEVTEFAFTAFATGRFPVNVHRPDEPAAAHDEAPVVLVEVYPR